MNPRFRRNRDHQNADQSWNQPDLRCECGALDSEHDDHGDPFTDATKTCARTQCVGFKPAMRSFQHLPVEVLDEDGTVNFLSTAGKTIVCECKPCGCENGHVVTEWRHYPGHGRGPHCATSEAVRMDTCPRCNGSGKKSDECMMHVELGPLDLIEVDGGR